MTNQRKLMAVVCAASIAAGGCGNGSIGGVKEACRDEQVSALTAAPAPKLLLSQKLLGTLQARAKKNDPAWTELRAACDKWSTAPVNAPGGPAYGSGVIASGYQGDGYLAPLLSLSLCYRTLSGTDDAAAAKYAAQGGKVLEAMSTPGSVNPGTDHGYGIRNYGVGMALGYDWLRPTLSATLRQRVITALDAWISWYDSGGFTKNDPIANYFVGYLLAKTYAAITIEPDDAKGGVWFADVKENLWGKLVKPKFSAYMKGGGWPEGWGYGPRAVRGVAEFLWAVKTGKNLDWAKEVPQVRDQAAYVSHFAWPALNRMDDQGTVRSGIGLQPSAALTTALATALAQLGDPEAPRAASFAADVLAKTTDDREPWQKFMYWDPALPKTAYTSQPKSYFAEGPGHVAMRSEWTSQAVWGAFSGGSYINAPASGEQMFNAGGLSVVVGADPLLVNATGWIPSTANTAGEDFVYKDSWGGGGRRLYNTFFVDDPTNPYNPGQNTADPTKSKAKVDRYADGGSFVRARATGLEDQYGASGSHPVQQLSRDLVYVRPGTFVIRDLSTVESAGADQWLAFHTAAAPTSAATADPSMKRFDVGNLGSIVSVLPENVQTKSVSLPGGATRIELHTPTKAAANEWLTVVAASGSLVDQVRLSPTEGNVLSGQAVGVELRDAENHVVLFADGEASTSYVVEAHAGEHVLVGLAPSASGYSVSAKPAAGETTITVTPGGAYEASADGTLAFSLTSAGQPDQPAPPSGGTGSGSGGSGGSTGSGGAPSSGSGGSGGGSPSDPPAKSNPPCSEPASPCVDDIDPSGSSSGGASGSTESQKTPC